MFSMIDYQKKAQLLFSLFIVTFLAFSANSAQESEFQKIVLKLTKNFEKKMGNIKVKQQDFQSLLELISGKEISKDKKKYGGAITKNRTSLNDYKTLFQAIDALAIHYDVRRPDIQNANSSRETSWIQKTYEELMKSRDNIHEKVHVYLVFYLINHRYVENKTAGLPNKRVKRSDNIIELGDFPANQAWFNAFKDFYVNRLKDLGSQDAINEDMKEKIAEEALDAVDKLITPSFQRVASALTRNIQKPEVQDKNTQNDLKHKSAYDLLSLLDGRGAVFKSIRFQGISSSPSSYDYYKSFFKALRALAEYFAKDENKIGFVKYQKDQKIRYHHTNGENHIYDEKMKNMSLDHILDDQFKEALNIAEKVKKGKKIQPIEKVLRSKYHVKTLYYILSLMLPREKKIKKTFFQAYESEWFAFMKHYFIYFAENVDIKTKEELLQGLKDIKTQQPKKPVGYKPSAGNILDSIIKFNKDELKKVNDRSPQNVDSLKNMIDKLKSKLPDQKDNPIEVDDDDDGWD